MRSKLTLADMQRTAQARGGRCLSRSYAHRLQRLRWQCRAGHVWESRAANVRAGKWCPQCSGKAPLTLKLMRELAQAKGGRCLSTRFIKGTAKLRWRCAHGHVWEAAGKNIRAGNWCPACAGHKRLTLDEFVRLARARGGECLATAFVNSRTPIPFRCGKGHQWLARPDQVKAGSWCAHCAPRACLTLEQMQEMAQARGGQCLSTRYRETTVPLEWQCRRGHVWRTRPSNIRQGKWCPYCGRTRRNVRHAIEEMQRLAREKGGRCLSKRDRGSKFTLVWQCRQGHVWRARGDAIKKGCWCPRCAGLAPLTIQEMRRLARAHRGHCISRRYVNSYTPLVWKCSEGHYWRAEANTIKQQGSWCPYCARKFVFTLERIQKLACDHNGWCLSMRYHRPDCPLKWSCQQGHVWRANPTKVRAGLWCPHCQTKPVPDQA